jgi:hypothetical protein
MDDQTDPFDEGPPPVKRKRRKQQPSWNARWIMCSEDFLVQMLKILSGKQIGVALFIQQRAMMHNTDVVRVTGEGLDALCLSRKVKRQALTKMVKARHLEWVRRPRNSNPTVRILGSLWLRTLD